MKKSSSKIEVCFNLEYDCTPVETLVQSINDKVQSEIAPRKQDYCLATAVWQCNLVCSK